MSYRRLNWEAVVEIRKLHDETDVNFARIADAFGISEGQVWSIVNNKTYRDPDYKCMTKKERVARGIRVMRQDQMLSAGQLVRVARATKTVIKRTEREARLRRLEERWESDPDWRSKLGTDPDDME